MRRERWWKVARLVALSGVLFGFVARADVEHQVVRRVVVFPLLGSANNEAAEDAWWQSREALTSDQRFLVASRNFLIQKDVFQPRGALSPADAIILGKLLDAQALVTLAIESSTLSLRVYEGEYGRPLWMKSLVLANSLPLQDQLASAAVRLIRDFMAGIPYQGYVVVDELRGRALFTEKTEARFLVRIPEGAQVKVGDKAQVLRIVSESLKPLFSADAPVEVIGEGEVVEVVTNSAMIRLDRAVKGMKIREGTPIRFPAELRRLSDAFSLTAKLNPESMIASATMIEQRERIAERRPLIASVTFFVNLVVFLILAF